MIPPAFRVGITGALTLTTDTKALAKLRAQLDAVLAQIKDEVTAHATAPRAAGIYAPGPPHLRIISPLAEGADRLVARAGLALGYQLDAPLPFAQSDYEKDFPASRDEFRELLAQAGPRVLAIDGGRSDADEQNRSYEAVGRLVARNCDLLIAIWDGGKGKGRGGTADIVRFAARQFQPIWWLRPDGSGEPCWIESLQDLRRPGGCAGGAAAARLKICIRTAILPPLEEVPTQDPLRDFLAAQPKRDFWPWNTYQNLMWRAAGKPPPAPALSPPVPPAGETWPYWDRHFAPADRLAVDYGKRYRSSYILVFFLAAAALGAATLGIGFGAEAWAGNVLELGCLGFIYRIVHLNETGRWHERLITYRLLAELFRKQQALALLGWSLPAAEAAHVSGDSDGLPTAPPRDVWVGWYFNAVVRASPLPQGTLGGPALAELHGAVLASLIAGQVDYHVRRRRDSQTIARRLGRWGRRFFFATVALVVFKFLVLSYGLVLAGPPPAAGSGDPRYGVLTTVLRTCLGLLPGLSAAFVGIRGYAELELLADQSAQMQRLLTGAEARLRSLDLAAPLASQELGLEVLALAEAMLLDLKGWAQLFRVKVVEPG